MHQEKDRKRKEDDVIPKGAVPAYLLDRQGRPSTIKSLSKSLASNSLSSPLSAGISTDAD